MEKNSSVEWEIIRNHSSDLLTQDLVIGGFYKYCDMQQYGAAFKIPFVKYEHATGDISWSKEHMENIRALVLSEEVAERLIENLTKTIDDYQRFFENWKEKIKTTRHSVDLIEEWFDMSQKIIPLVAYFVFEEALSKKLAEEGLEPRHVRSSPTEVTRASEEISKLQTMFSGEIARREVISDTFRTALEQIVETYGYLGMKYFGGNPWTVTDVYQMVVHSTPVSSRTEKQDTEATSKTVEYLATLLHLRTVKWEMMCKSTFLLREYLIKDFYKEVRYEDLLSHPIEEVLAILRGNYSVAHIKHERYVLIVDENGYRLIDGQPEDSLETRPATPVLHGQEIRGAIAYKGKVRGAAKIILSPKDAHRIQPGDILIATMSTPDFLPAMQRASAFVTDIGGITSHAAIVSREMKKPCVIGTKLATKVFKDGDYIEVDANNGVVRIVEK